jgi:pimeloyl-ACP methyl ester carboxylesterase
MRRLTLLGVFTSCVVVVSGVAPVAVATPSEVPSIAWGTCDVPALVDAGAQCAMLSVPLDYAHPEGTKIKLAVSRIKHTVPDSQAQGVMLINAGGPGVAGIADALSTFGQLVPNGAGGFYDWIGFDPRGVGESQPALSCEPNYFDFSRPTYIPLLQSTVRTWLALAKGYAQACAANNGPILSHMTTIDAAKDMDSIRAALGVAQINYYGYSWGTYLGQVYGTLFATHVRRMVLDSNVDPRNVYYQANLIQDVGFDRTLKIWFGWLAQYDSVYHLGKTAPAVEALFYRTEAQLTLHPADGKIGGDEWLDIFLQTGYKQFNWPLLADAFAGYVNNGDVANLENLFLLIDGLRNDNSYAVYSAVQCTDVQWPQQWSTWARDNWATFARAPFETWANAWYNAPCLFWPARPQQPVTVDGRRASGALLIDQTLDAPTPFEGSLEVRQLFPNSSLIALPGGTTHGSSLSGDTCLDDQVAAYLADGTLPPRRPGNGPDTTCAPPPMPVPRTEAAAPAVGSLLVR